MAKQKHVIWLCKTNTKESERKKKILEQHGYLVSCVTSITSLKERVKLQRANIVAVSQDQNPADLCEDILQLAKVTETKGSKWLLFTIRQNTKLQEYAAGANFKDFIPLDLPDKIWMQRFLYATVGHSLNYPIPNGQLSHSSLVNVEFPFRLIWITESKLRLESHVTPSIGSILKLKGHLNSELGTKIIDLNVQAISSTRLNYRYSSAIEGTWTYANKDASKCQNVIKQLRIFSPKQRHRVFLAVRNQGIRRDLNNLLSSEEFELNSAIQLKSLGTEPSFFTPDLIIVESFLCQEKYLDNLYALLDTTPNSVPLIIVGTKEFNPKSNARLNSSDRKIFSFYQVPPGFLAHINSLLKSPKKKTKASGHELISFFQSDDPIAFGSIVVSGSLNKVHPRVIELSLNHPVKDFAIGKLISPLYKKWLPFDPWIKLTKSSKTVEQNRPPTIQTTQCILISINSTQQSNITKQICRLVEIILMPKGEVGHLPQEEANLNIASEEEFEQNKKTVSKLQSEIKVSTKPPQRHKTSSKPKVAGYLILAGLIALSFVFLIYSISTMNLKPSGAIFSEQLQKYRNSVTKPHDKNDEEEDFKN